MTNKIKQELNEVIEELYQVAQMCLTEMEQTESLLTFECASKMYNDTKVDIKELEKARG